MKGCAMATKGTAPWLKVCQATEGLRLPLQHGKRVEKETALLVRPELIGAVTHIWNIRLAPVPAPGVRRPATRSPLDLTLVQLPLRTAPVPIIDIEVTTRMRHLISDGLRCAVPPHCVFDAIALKVLREQDPAGFSKIRPKPVIILNPHEVPSGVTVRMAAIDHFPSTGHSAIEYCSPLGLWKFASARRIAEGEVAVERREFYEGRIMAGEPAEIVSMKVPDARRMVLKLLSTGPYRPKER
jgi:hypothetical protein